MAIAEIYRKIRKKLAKDLMPPRLQELRRWKKDGGKDMAVYKHYIDRFNEDLTSKCIGDFGCGPYGGVTFFAGGYPIDINARAYNKWGWSKKRILQSREIPDKTIDVMFCCDAIDHTRCPEKIIKEIRRLLKPSGTLLLHVHFREVPNVRHPVVWSVDLLRSLFKDFNIVWHKVEEGDAIMHNKKVNNTLWAKLQLIN
ncbi:MAG: methyltransferase domain-containing protein [Candidatus Omnitrophica bacterium]|nr:methyltransferase domain-containing protein [Candidatus Omnitrophota bacterium]